MYTFSFVYGYIYLFNTFLNLPFIKYIEIRNTSSSISNLEIERETVSNCDLCSFKVGCESTTVDFGTNNGRELISSTNQPCLEVQTQDFYQ